MNLELTEEQTLLREAVGEMLARSAGDDGLVPGAAGDALWRELVEFGALEVGGDEGLGAVELALICWSLGRTARRGAVRRQRSARVRRAGPRPRGARLERARPELRAGESLRPRSTRGRSRARRARSRSRRRSTASPSPRPVPTGLSSRSSHRTADGVSLESEPTLDTSLKPARVGFESAGAEPLADGSSAAALVESLAAVAGVLAAAEAVGAAAAVLDLACAYAAQRRQFGQTIGSFQAIRHLLADMYVKVESSWSSVLYAAAALDEREPDSLRTASIAKAYAGRATHEVAHGALQVFGGIAFTAEHPAHRFLRRIAVRSGQFGTPREHERSLGRGLAQRLEVPA